MNDEPQELLEAELKQAEIRWFKLLEESSNTCSNKETKTQKSKSHKIKEKEEDWKELEANLKEAEERWKRKIEEYNLKLVEKPEVLHLGPRPRTIKERKAKEEISFEIFPLPKPHRLRGDFVNREKHKLTLLNHELTWEVREDRIQAIKSNIASIKKRINAFRKQKKKNKKMAIKYGTTV